MRLSENCGDGLHDPVPLFPLATVLYPEGLLPLRIFEPRYLDMVSMSLRDDTPFGIVPIKHGSDVGPTPHFFNVGCLCKIEKWDQGADGLLQIVVRGDQRFRVVNHEIRSNLLLVGEIEYLDDVVDRLIPDEFEYLRQLLSEIFNHNQEHVLYGDWKLDSAVWVAHRLAEVLPLDMSAKVEILEHIDALDTLESIGSYVQALKDK